MQRQRRRNTRPKSPDMEAHMNMERCVGGGAITLGFSFSLIHQFIRCPCIWYMYNV